MFSPVFVVPKSDFVIFIGNSFPDHIRMNLTDIIMPHLPKHSK